MESCSREEGWVSILGTISMRSQEHKPPSLQLRPRLATHSRRPLTPAARQLSQNCKIYVEKDAILPLPSPSPGPSPPKACLNPRGSSSEAMAHGPHRASPGPVPSPRIFPLLSVRLPPPGRRPGAPSLQGLGLQGALFPKSHSVRLHPALPSPRPFPRPWAPWEERQALAPSCILPGPEKLRDHWSWGTSFTLD